MGEIKQTIVPHLWFDKEAEEAAEFYASVFPHSRVTDTTVLQDTPSGDSEIISFELWGQKVMAVSAGPFFQFNPSMSFMVNVDPLLFDASPAPGRAARDKVDEVWARLSEGGTVLMPLGSYPFSHHYGWIQDRYGLSWQLILTNPGGDPRPPIMPSLLFVGQNWGKAEEAINFYLSVFKDASLGNVSHYGAGQEPEREGTTMFADFRLEDLWFVAMDSGLEHGFSFNEAVSFIVYCDDQEEIDTYWDRLSAVPEAEQSGWLRDKYGISWQIVPSALDDMMRSGTEEQVARVTQAFLAMRKLDLGALQRAYDGKAASEGQSLDSHEAGSHPSGGTTA